MHADVNIFVTIFVMRVMSMLTNISIDIEYEYFCEDNEYDL